jgi:hypothetical protein
MNYVQTIAPIPIDQIKEYFKDKNTFFMVDYQQSKIQGKVLLVYLSNLDIPSDLVLNESVTKEQKFELIEAYFGGNSVSNIAYLNVAAAQIILQAIYPDANYGKSLLSKEECEEFITKNESLVGRWIHFIDSTMLFLIKSFEDLNAELNVKENFENIDDPHYVGLNVVNLFSLPGFLEIYFSVDRPLSLTYFTQQFEAHMFKGKSLFDYYNNDLNMFVPLLYQMINKEIPLNPEEVFGVE